MLFSSLPANGLITNCLTNCIISFLSPIIKAVPIFFPSLPSLPISKAIFNIVSRTSGSILSLNLWVLILKKTLSTSKTNIKAFEEARNAVIKLETLSRLLSPADLETLEIILDKKAINLLSKSFNEAERGKLEPIEKIV